jgi:preprotein translocase subunit SecF
MRPFKLIPDNTNIPFLKYRNWAMGLSVTLIIASIVLVVVRGFNLGIDFRGGQSVRVEFQQPVKAEDLRHRIGALGLGEPTIQEYGSAREYGIRTPLPESGITAEQAAAKIRTAIEQAYPGAHVGAVESVTG